MSGRPTAADRLAELDAEVDSLTRSLGVRADRLDKIDALRPPCPRCGGLITHPTETVSCSGCVDGKVSIEQLAVTWRAVWYDPMGIKPEGHTKCEPCALCVLEHLRAVRP